MKVGFRSLSVRTVERIQKKKKKKKLRLHPSVHPSVSVRVCGLTDRSFKLLLHEMGLNRWVDGETAMDRSW